MIPVESSGGPFKTKAQMTLAAPRETSHIQKYLMMNATGLNPGAERPLLAALCLWSQAQSGRPDLK